MGQITTTPNVGQDATGLVTEKRLERLTTGGLIALTKTNTGTEQYRLFGSADQGGTWSSIGVSTSTASGSYARVLDLATDPDDCLSVLFTEFTQGVIQYNRWTPNAGRTAWTLTGATGITDGQRKYHQHVTHREGTGWVSHVVYTNNDSGTEGFAYYRQISINSSGQVTSVGAEEIVASMGSGNGSSSNVNTGVHVGIALRHTGDGKTVTSPDLFFVICGDTTPTTSIIYRKKTYNAGAWTWGSPVTVDNTRGSLTSIGPRIMWDGTRVVIAGLTLGSSGAGSDWRIYDVNPTTGAVTPRAVTSTYTNGSGVPVTVNPATGDLYFAIVQGNTTAGLVKWTRATNTYGAFEAVSASPNNDRAPNTRHVTHGGQVDMIWSRFGNGSTPYPLISGQRSTNSAPDTQPAPTSVDGANLDRAQAHQFLGSFSDADPGDSLSKTDWRWRTSVNGTTGSWNVVTVTGSTPAWTAAASTFPASGLEVQFLPYDAQGAPAAAYSPSLFVTAGNAPATPAFTAPASGATLTTATNTVTWTATSQEGYEVRRVQVTGGNPDPSVVYGTTGLVTSTARTRQQTFGTTGRQEFLQVRVQVAGIWSAYASRLVTVALVPPAAPSITATPATTGTPRVQVSGVWSRGSVEGTASLVVQRSLDGTSWSPAGTTVAGATGDATFLFDDLAVATGAVAYYRALVAATVNGESQTGPYSATATATMSVYADYFVNLTTQVASVVRLQTSSRDARPWEGSVVYPLEGTTAIILSGRQFQPEGSCVAAFRTWPAALQFEGMLLGVDPLLWRRPADSSGWQRPDLTVRVRPGSVRLTPAEDTMVRWAACLVEFQWISQ